MSEEVINKRIYERNISNKHLDVLYPLIPYSTKFQKFPTTPTMQNIDTNISNKLDYNYSAGMHPGTSRGPIQGFMQNVDFESSLRNQFFALQKCDQSNFVPNSNSDLYVETTIQTTPYKDNHGLLFKTHSYKNNKNVKKEDYLFNNYTRFQRN